MVNAKAPSTFYDLVQGMKGKRTIGNWDVLVTYDEETLNKRLAEQADKSKLLEDVVVETSILNVHPRKQLPAHVTLKLSTPVLAFGPGDNEAHLRLNLGGSFKIDDDTEATSFPPDFRVDIRASLAATVGHFDDGHFKKSEAAGNATAGAVLGVPDDPTLLCGVYLDFPTGSTDWKIIDKEGKPADGSVATIVWQLVAKAMESFLAKQNTRWFVGGIKKAAPDPNEIQLVPETFRFTVLVADPAVKDSKGAVCMWIKVKDSPGQSNGTEGFDNFNSHPIPQGHTASVVFSHDLLVHSVLKPSLESSASSWMGSVRPAGSDPAHKEDEDADATYAGIHLKAPSLTKNENDLYFFKPYQLEGDIDITVKSDIVVDGSPSLTVSWDSGTFSQDITTGGGYAPYTTHCSEWQCLVRGSGSWTGKGTEIDMATTISRVIKQRSSDTRLWTTSNEKAATSSPVTLTSNVKPIQYLLTTNLLFPNQHIFSADPVQAPKGTAQKDIKGGLACPHDLILTGNLMEKPVQVAAAFASTPLREPTFHAAAAVSLPGITDHMTAAANDATDGGAVAKGTLEDYKNALFSDKNNDFARGLMQSVAKDSVADSTVNLIAFMKAKGYDHLTPEELLLPIGHTPDSFATADADSPVDIAAPVDIRYFAGHYSIWVGPSADKGVLLEITPISRKIHYRKGEYELKPLVGPSGKPLNKYSFTHQGKTYTFSCKSWLDGETGTKARLVGEVTEEGKPSSHFLAGPPSERPKPPPNGIHAMEWNEGDTIAVVLGISSTLISIAIAYIAYRIGANAQRKLLAADALKAAKITQRAELLPKLKEDMKDIMKSEAEGIESQLKKVMDVVREKAKKQWDGLSDADKNAGLNPQDIATAEKAVEIPLKTIETNLTKEYHQALRDMVDRIIKTRMDAQLSVYENAGQLIQIDPLEPPGKKLVDAAVADWVLQVTRKDMTTTNPVREVLTTVLATERAVKGAGDASAASAEYKKAADSAEQAKSDQEAAQKAVNDADYENGKDKASGKTEAELQKELQDKVDEQKAADKIERDLKANEKKLSDEKDKREKEKKDADDAAEKRRKEVRDKVEIPHA